MDLPTTRLGSSGIDITRVGFGTWAAGGGGWRFGWGGQDDADSIRAIHRAVSAGVNWIDTAPIYGRGRAEAVLGRALAQLPSADRPRVFTKCGLTWRDDDPDPAPRNEMAAASVRHELDASLRRLGVDSIDLYLVHWPPLDGTPLEAYWSTMLELREEGRVGAVGLSNHDLAAVRAAEAIGHVDALQPPLSLIARAAAADLVPWCADHGTGVVVYSPMQSGLLTGALTVEMVNALPDDDWRSTSPDFSGEGLRRNLALAAALEPVAQRHGVAVPAVAVAWTLAWPGVSGAIVGAREPREVDGWLPAADLVLDSDDLDRIAAAVEATGAGCGPVRPGAS